MRGSLSDDEEDDIFLFERNKGLSSDSSEHVPLSSVLVVETGGPEAYLAALPGLPVSLARGGLHSRFAGLRCSACTACTSPVNWFLIK